MASTLHDTARTVASWLAEGRDVAVGRVISIQGFSTWPGDEMLAVDGAGEVAGAVLGSPGTAQLRDVAVDLLRSGEERRTVTVEIHGKAVIEAGLSCGGQADVLLQPARVLPTALWDRFAARAPVALVSPAGGPSVLVAEASAAPDDGMAALGAELLASGHSAVRSVEDPAGGTVLVEAWVPAPRLVVVGSGDLVGALDAQAALLGWESCAVDDAGEVDGALEWAGASGALVVLSHDPHVDVPALQTGLRRGTAYIGAMGSRRTQSRRVDRLTEAGLDAALLDRIHRPVGLDLGGRSAAEVALAICAEILAVRTGRDGRSLRERSGPIHDRPSVGA